VRWCSFTVPSGGPPRLGAVDPADDSRLLDVGAWARSREADAPADLVDLVSASASTQEHAADMVRSAPEDATGWVRLADVTLLAPLREPNSLRDFLAFRDHVERGAARRGGAVPEAWDRIPVYYKGNRRSILGPDDPAPWPSYTDRLDYECEVAAVVGAGGRDLSEDEAAGHVFGYTIMNDWSARDVQKDEMSCWLGPAKAKDFATTLGPWVVTPDEWNPEDDHAMTVTVDGEVWSQGSTTGRRWTFGQMLAWVSRDEDLWPTDVLGSGTFGGGCGLDLDRWVRPGAVVELSVEGLGRLANRVAQPSISPSPRAQDVL
jgi:2-keto-4-pentenoate hydratase/2-oxohepta-3-ene-1,7-dioic acid hydratase in catechol pathway